MPSNTTDLKRERRDLNRPPADRVTVVDMPEMRFLAVDGAGNPNTALAYQEALEAIAYAIKFLRKMTSLRRMFR